MESFPEHNPKHASHTKPTIEEIKKWDEDELLEWIQQKEPKLLKERLADLASEIAGGKTAGMVQKGKEQDTSTGKSTDHTPLLFSLH